jgi:hypothetical protein
MEEPGLIDRAKAFPAIKKSGCEGWFAFETPILPRGAPDSAKNRRQRRSAVVRNVPSY